MYIVGGRYYPLAISTQACQVVGDDISVKYLALVEEPAHRTCQK